MTDDMVKEVRKSALGSLTSGTNLGSNPTKEEIKKEVERLKNKGKDANEIGKQIGVYYIMKKNNEVLDKLEEVLTEEFDDYGKKKLDDTV